MSSLDQSYSTGEPVTLTSARAGFWRRFAASLIDGILLSIVSAILQAIIGRGGGYGIGILITLGYFTYFHGTTGQTQGDAALSIRVVGKDTGAPIGYSRAFVRWLVSLVSGIVILLGYLWMLWDSEKQTWHDKAANSVVVPTG
jgi:uncharacterized RDD family membrane protein YckC